MLNTSNIVDVVALWDNRDWGRHYIKDYGENIIFALVYIALSAIAAIMGGGGIGVAMNAITGVVFVCVSNHYHIKNLESAGDGFRCLSNGKRNAINRLVTCRRYTEDLIDFINGDMKDKEQLERLRKQAEKYYEFKNEDPEDYFIY